MSGGELSSHNEISFPHIDLIQETRCNNPNTICLSSNTLQRHSKQHYYQYKTHHRNHSNFNMTRPTFSKNRSARRRGTRPGALRSSHLRSSCRDNIQFSSCGHTRPRNRSTRQRISRLTSLHPIENDHRNSGIDRLNRISAGLTRGKNRVATAVKIRWCCALIGAIRNGWTFRLTCPETWGSRGSCVRWTCWNRRTSVSVLREPFWRIRFWTIASPYPSERVVLRWL